MLYGVDTYGPRFLFKGVKVEQLYEQLKTALLAEIEATPSDRLPRDTDEEEGFVAGRVPRLPELGEVRYVGTEKGEGRDVFGGRAMVDFNVYEVAFHGGAPALFDCNPRSHANMPWGVTPHGEVMERCLRFKAQTNQDPDRQVEDFKREVQGQLDKLRPDMVHLDTELRRGVLDAIRRARSRAPRSKY